jgi:DNA-binding transcriptional MocR family regulator
MPFTLDRASNVPLYLQLKEQIKGQIESGVLLPGSRLPPSRELASQLGVNRITVISAYEELAAEGLISSHVGRGTFVATPSACTYGAGTGGASPSAGSPADAPATWTAWWSAPLSPHSMLREMMRMARQPGVISLADGAPATEFLPVNPFREAINTVLRRDGADALQYDVAEGYVPLRAAIAEHLATQGVQTTAAQVLVTSGCQQGLDLVIQVQTQPGDVVLVESPTYLGALDLFEARHLKVIGVLVDRNGLQVERLEGYILQHRPKLIYVAPTFQNPTGATLSLERRRLLLAVAGKYGVPILEDGVYTLLRYEGERLPPLAALDNQDLVTYVSSFSKILLPGVRVGYLVANNPLYERLAAAKQAVDIYTSSLDQRALHAYLAAGHLQRHLERVCQVYRERRDAMMDSARRHLPLEARWEEPQGGLYLWVQGPPDLSITHLYLTAVRYGVAFAIGSVFFPSGRAEPCLRLNFVSHPPETIEEGMRRLGKAWRELHTQTASEAASTYQSIQLL